MPETVVVGQIARDLILRVEDAPAAGGSARVRTRLEILGGKGANQAVALAQCGVTVGLVGVVAEDEVGARLVQQAHTDGIEVSEVVRRSRAETALLVDVVDDHGQYRYLEHIPEDVLLTEGDVRAASEMITHARSVLVQLQQPPPVALTAVRLARTAGARVIVDGAARGRSLEVLAEADVVRADAREAEYLAGKPISGVSEAMQAASTLLDQGPALVVLEVAGEGNVVVDRAGQEFLPLLDVPIVDTTGCGDVLVATLAAALDRGEPVPDAARAAIAAAASTAGHAGGRPRLRPADLDPARVP